MRDLTKEPEAVSRAKDEPRLRPCLVCREMFPSAGFGERICRHCKSTKLWKAGRLDGPMNTSRRR